MRGEAINLVPRLFPLRSMERRGKSLGTRLGGNSVLSLEGRYRKKT